MTAPLDGVLRGLTRDGVPVTVRTKIIEVDPRGQAGEVRGIAERPRFCARVLISYQPLVNPYRKVQYLRGTAAGLLPRWVVQTP